MSLSFCRWCISVIGRRQKDRGGYGAQCFWLACGLKPTDWCLMWGFLLPRLFDVSKQVVGQMFVHGFNVFVSDLSSNHTEGNACVFYFLNILIDTTLGSSSYSWLEIRIDVLPCRRRSHLCYPSLFHIYLFRKVPPERLRVGHLWLSPLGDILDAPGGYLCPGPNNHEVVGCWTSRVVPCYF